MKYLSKASLGAGLLFLILQFILAISLPQAALAATIMAVWSGTTSGGTDNDISGTFIYDIALAPSDTYSGTFSASLYDNVNDIAAGNWMQATVTINGVSYSSFEGNSANRGVIAVETAGNLQFANIDVFTSAVASENAVFHINLRINTGGNSSLDIPTLLSWRGPSTNLPSPGGIFFHDNASGVTFVPTEMNIFLAPQPVPIPAALPLFAAGLSAMGFMGWRRKRKAIA